MFIPITKPSIKRSDMDSVLTCMVSDNLGPGVISERLVKDVSEYLGVEGGAAFREYRRAIRLAMEALGLTKGSKIILTPLCPRAYSDVCSDMEIEILFVDVEPETGCIAVEQIDQFEGQEIGAIVVHANLGFAPNMEALLEYQVPMIEDISQALGANTGIKRLGSYGNYIILSLEPENIVTSGGGVLLLGRGKKETGQLKRLTEDYVPELFLPDFNSALGITQIKTVERFIERRKEIAQIFSRAVMQSRHKILVQKGDGENIYYSFPIIIDSGMKDVQAYARKKGIETKPAFSGSIIAFLPEEEKKWPTAASLFLRCLLFPLYPTLTKPGMVQIEKVLTTLP